MRRSLQNGETAHAWGRRINIGTITILPKAIHRFNETPRKILIPFFKEIIKTTVRFIRKHKRTQPGKAVLSKKCTAGGVTVPDFKFCHRAIVIKTTWFWHRTRYAEQWSRIKDSYIYIKVLAMVSIRLLAKMPKIYYGERTALSTNGAGETGFLQAN